MNWYIVQAYSGFEKKVVESIKDTLNKNNLDTNLEEILVPTHQVTEVKKGKRSKKEKKYFPGYVLVKIELTNQIYHLIKNLQKVSGFLGSEDKPTPISDTEIQRILGQVSESEKKKLTQEEKEYKSLRKQIQEKLIKFATRIPIFMYLTDYRERRLKDVITKLEPGLFKRVTGLDVSDFELLVSLNVFNSSLMNDAIYKFKRYEDASLSYSGIYKHKGNDIGLFDTVIKNEKIYALEN